MVEQGVERGLEGVLAGRVGGDRHAAEMDRRIAVLGGIELHRIDAEFVRDHRIILPVDVDVLHTGKIVIVAGEDMRQVHDVVLAVGIDRAAVGVLLFGPVGVEHAQPDREELHHLARIILIGLATGGLVFLKVALGVEVHAHAGIERDMLEQVAEIAEGAIDQQIPPGGHDVRRPEAVDRIERDHEELRQRIGRAQPELARLGQHLVPDHEIAGHRPEIMRVLGDRVVMMRGQPVDPGLGARHPELCVEPGGIAMRTDEGDVGIGCTELRAEQETRGLRLGDAPRGDGRFQRGSAFHQYRHGVILWPANK